MSFVYTEPRESLGNIQTPLYVSKFLYDLVKHLKPKCVLDPACGKGVLLQPWLPKFKTIGVEIDEKITNTVLWSTETQLIHKPFENVELSDFSIIPDLVLCNPPWNRHQRDSISYPEVFLKKIIHLLGNKIPIVFLCPMGFRMNQRKVSKRTKWLKETMEISSIITCPLDMYPATQFHNEIILFNIKRVKPHYWMVNEPN